MIHCTACGTQVLPTMRICPQCGGRSFSEFAPILPGASQQVRPAVGGAATAPARPAELASSGSRLLAYCIDVALINIALTVMGRFISADPSLDVLQTLRHTFVSILALATLIFLSYYTLLETAAPGGSLGKRMLGLSVVNQSGEHLRLGQSFGRALVHWLLSQLWLLGPLAIAAAQVNDKQVEMLLITAGFGLAIGPFIVALFDANRRTVVDRIYQQKVIKAKKAP